MSGRIQVVTAGPEWACQWWYRPAGTIIAITRGEPERFFGCHRVLGYRRRGRVLDMIVRAL